MTDKERLDFLEELLLSCHNLFLWRFTPELHLLDSNCPSADAAARLLLRQDEKNADFPKLEGLSVPLLFTTSQNVLWILDRSPKTDEICALGPYFSEDAAVREVRKYLRHQDLLPADRDALLALLDALPVIPLSKTYEYALMLHRTLTGETISISDFVYTDLRPAEAPVRPSNEDIPIIVHGTYDVEQSMLRAVREGDVENFHGIMKKMQNSGAMGQIAPKGNDKRLMKNAILVNIVLFSRAAIEGGLPPDLSYSLSDRYMQGVESCRTLQELQELALTMQEDYVNRVHKLRENPELSGLTRSILAWLDTHLEDTVRIGDIAADFGYSSYYLSRRFKQEYGKSISACLREKRLDRAKFLLESSDLPVHEISDTLQFSSPSYFTELFRKTYGTAPSEYRAKNRTP